MNIVEDNLVDTETLIGQRLESITPDMLSSPYKEIAKLIGVENLYKLVKKVWPKNKRTVYIASAYKCFKEPLKQMVLEEYYKGDISIPAIAEKYGLSKNTIQSYINNDKKKA